MTGDASGRNAGGPDPTAGVSALIDVSLLDRIRETVGSVTRPWWHGEVMSRNGLIHGVNVAGSRPPLVWCFQGYAEFAAFAKGLGPDQPLYGMRSGHMVVNTSSENHLHMAMVCADELYSLGLKGPLFIGGNCQGALQAQKIAEIMMMSGQAVSLVVGLNPLVFTPYPGRAALIVGRYDSTNPMERFHDADLLLRANLPNGTVDTLPSQHGELFSGRILALLCEVVRRRMDEAAADYPGSFPLWSLSAEFTVPARMGMIARGLYDVPVTVRNTSGAAWAPAAQSGLSVGNHWHQTDGSLVQWLDGQYPLKESVPPGASVNLDLLVRAPEKEGEYLLKLDLQHAGIGWLSELGVETSLCQVTVSGSEAQEQTSAHAKAASSRPLAAKHRKA